MNIRCIAIDDEPVALDILSNHAKQIPFLNMKETFRDAFKALTFLQTHEIDLLFLDVNMPDLSGIQFLKSLDNPPLVIFTTAYSEYALESYDFEAVDYLLKPIEFDRFLKAVNRANSRLASQRSLSQSQFELGMRKSSSEHSILIKSGSDIHKIDTKDIFYIQGAGNYLTFHARNKEIMTLMTMKEALLKLPQNEFFHIHRSYIVSFHNIDVIDRDHVTVGGVRLPIGETFRDAFFTAIQSK